VITVDFDGVVQVSDLLTVHNVPGVGGPVLTSDDNPTHYAIQQIAEDGTTILHTYDNGGTPKRAIDVLINDNEVPVLNDVVIKATAQNRFGAT
jgi:hypothetical protein